MNTPLVSVIVPTKNSDATLDNCLKTIKDQSYNRTEIIVVDNFSTDDTQVIADRYAKLYIHGPERSAQRNYGVSKSNGEYILMIDSDMELDKNVINDCVTVFENDLTVNCVVIPEESFGIGFWAKCKKLERSFYVGVPWMEAARAFRRDTYISIGGYNENMISGEDWDLSQRISTIGKISRIKSYIKHNEGKLQLRTDLQKKYYYAKKFSVYRNNGNNIKYVNTQASPIARYILYLSNPAKLMKNPIIGVGMLFMKTSEFAYGALGIGVAGRKSG
jgi:glycosyltransferase involved in cell wall biosynthesis